MQAAGVDAQVDVLAKVNDFVSQSQRVLNVTHKPKRDEFSHIAKSTALGIALIGAIGLTVSAIMSLFQG